MCMHQSQYLFFILISIVGRVRYDIRTAGPAGFINMLVQVVDRDGLVVGSSSIAQDTISIQNANFWWPYTMNNLNPGYLYTLKVGTFHTMQVINFVIYKVVL